MPVGAFNPHDDANSSTVRPTSNPVSTAAERRWPTIGTRFFSEDMSDIIAQFRNAMDTLGVADSAGDDTILTQCLKSVVQPRTNYVTNPRFQVWPWGTSALTSTGETALGWWLAPGTGSTNSVARVTGMVGSTYALEWDRTVAGSAVSELRVFVPNVRIFGGQRVTVSGYIKGDTGTEVHMAVTQVFGNGGSSNVFSADTDAIPLSSTVAAFTLSFDVASVAGKTIGTGGDDYTVFNFARSITGGNGKITFEDIKIEIGAFASRFEVPTPQQTQQYSGAPQSHNYIENPAFEVWQDNTTYALAASTRTFVADRWIARRGSSTGTTISRQTGFNGAKYCLRMQRDAGVSSGQEMSVGQAIESTVARQLAGEWVIFSYDYRTGADYTDTLVRSVLVTGTGEDEAFTPNGTSSSFPTGSVATTVSPGRQRNDPTTSARRCICAPILIPDTTTEIGIVVLYDPSSGVAGSADYVEITNVKLEVCGPNGLATAFAMPDSGQTLDRCQRWYRKSFLQGTVPAQSAGEGTGEIRFPTIVNSADSAGVLTSLGTVRFGTPMKSTPAITLYNPSAANAQARDLDNGLDASNTTARNINPGGFEVAFNANSLSNNGDVYGFHYVADARV